MSPRRLLAMASAAVALGCATTNPRIVARTAVADAPPEASTQPHGAHHRGQAWDELFRFQWR